MNFNMRRYTSIIMMISFWIILIIGSLYIPRLLYSSQEEKSINMLIWPITVDPEMLKVFERETGIRVYINYFESNEELLAKLAVTKGRGYDLIVPSDYTVDYMIKNNMLQKIDHTKLNFYNRFNPRLLGHYFDHDNTYSLPFVWGVYGLGVDKEFFTGGTPEATWDLIFKENNYDIGMLDMPREAIQIVAKYLYGTAQNLTNDRLQKIQELLLVQKKWVYTYTSLQADYVLASRSSPVVVTSSSEIGNVMENYDFIDFIVPREGSFLVIDSLVIPAKSKKQDYIYELINFLYKKDIFNHHAQKYHFLSPMTDGHDEQKDGKQKEMVTFTDEEFKKLEFFKGSISEEQINDIWITLKSQ